MEIVINEGNLVKDEIDEISSKVRALLVDDDNNVLVANYSGVLLLPGGKLDDDEDVFDGIVRELSEEVGYRYKIDELKYLMTLNYYQNNYPKVNGTFKNRLVVTHYFVGEYNGIIEENCMLTDREKDNGFELRLISFEQVEKELENADSSNPRNVYFQKELSTVIDCYNKVNRKVYKKV